MEHRTRCTHGTHAQVGIGSHRVASRRVASRLIASHAPNHITLHHTAPYRSALHRTAVRCGVAHAPHASHEIIASTHCTRGIARTASYTHMAHVASHTRIARTHRRHTLHARTARTHHTHASHAHIACIAHLTRTHRMHTLHALHTLCARIARIASHHMPSHRIAAHRNTPHRMARTHCRARPPALPACTHAGMRIAVNPVSKEPSSSGDPGTLLCQPCDFVLRVRSHTRTACTLVLNTARHGAHVHVRHCPAPLRPGLSRTAPHSNASYCTNAAHHTIPHRTAPNRTALHRIALHYTALHLIA